MVSRKAVEVVGIGYRCVNFFKDYLCRYILWGLGIGDWGLGIGDRKEGEANGLGINDGVFGLRFINYLILDFVKRFEFFL